MITLMDRLAKSLPSVILLKAIKDNGFTGEQQNFEPNRKDLTVFYIAFP